MRRKLDYDPIARVTTWHELVDGKTVITYTTDVDMDSVTDVTRKFANDDSYTRRGIKEEFWHYAHVPNFIALKWLTEEGIPLYDAEAYNRKVNTPEYKALKVTIKHDGSRPERRIFLPHER